MDIRATSQTRISHAVDALRRSIDRQATLQNQISSGIRLQKPSDGPADYVAAQQALARVDHLQIYLETNSAATHDLDSSVSTLQDVTDALNQAAQVVTEGIHGANDASIYATLAQSVDSLITRVLTAVNTKADGRSLYAGTATDQPAYSITGTDSNGRPTTISYQGAVERGRVITGPNQTTDTRYVGTEIFGDASSGVFQTLIALRDSLRNPSLTAQDRAQQLTARLAEIQSARDTVLGVVGEQSSSLETLDAQQNQLRDLQTSLKIRAGDLQSTDIAEAITRLSEEQTAYQATLAITARIFGSSLMDYIK